MQRHLQCYAKGTPEGWEALCLDLDIAVQADSLADVTESLKEAIGLYFKTLEDLPEEDRIRLLSRQVPFWLRAKIYANVALYRLLHKPFNKRNGDNNRPSRENFTVQCPA